MLNKVLITGATGFAGSYLAEYLVKTKKYEITGTSFSISDFHNIRGIKKDINIVKVDLSKSLEVKELIEKTRPNLIFHLAALTSPADSFKNPVDTLTNNINAQVNLFEAIKDAKLVNSRILIISSADIYGKVAKEDLPIDEETKFMPTNPYSVSKIAQDYLGLQYFLSYGFKIIRVRPFNHAGPRQAPNFVIPSFAKKIAAIEKGKKEQVLKVGNLGAKRDFTDVRDMVRAYAYAIEKGKPGDVYNIGSGVSHTISSVLDELIAFSKTRIKIEVDSSLLRPSDEPELLCDNTKFNRLTGWKPEISITQTLKDTLDYWRNIV
ncbi:MAG: GDP-mannose 4,6-dehydratase [Patescibacteria group bacterium]|nr:GDP-mannose 4,6-dehydratase [Patescibacteria group bacterium]